MEKICPKCGSSNKDKTFVGSFCMDCINIKLTPPKKITLVFCKECNKLKSKNKWVLFDFSEVKKEIKKNTTGEFEDMFVKIDEENKKGKVKYIINIEGNFVEIKSEFEIETHFDLCKDCSRRRGSYYEGIIQVRGENKEKVKKMADKLEKIITRDSFISKIVELKEGIDLYVGSKQKAISSMVELKLKFKRTRTLQGVKKAGSKKGMKQYRDTFLVRI